MTYGANLKESFRRSATYVDKILKGAKPGDLPVEQATTFQPIINLKAAKEIGLTIPQSVTAGTATLDRHLTRSRPLASPKAATEERARSRAATRVEPPMQVFPRSSVRIR